jgi:hypothetical protein
MVRPVNRLVPRGYEEVEFVPVPGAEDHWAGFVYVARSALWMYLGILPVGGYLAVCLVLIGCSL